MRKLHFPSTLVFLTRMFLLLCMMERPPTTTTTTNSPFGFAGADKASLLYMREAEIKHGRLAMLAVVGWPIAELFDKGIAEALGLPIALTKSGNSPSVLNGGLEKIDVLYWVAVVTLAGIVEIESSKVQEAKGKEKEKKKEIF